MKLTTHQKISFIFFLGTLMLGYLIANWDHQTNISRINEAIEREKTLHLSTDQLLINCKKNASHTQNSYDANHQICLQGAEIHEHTSQALEALTQEKTSNDNKWVRNFFLTTALLNILGIATYRANIFLKTKMN